MSGRDDTTVRLGAGPNNKVKLRGFRLGKQRFDGPVVRIGADPTCDLVLDDSSVSRQHLQIEQTPSGWRVKDLQSTNGTLLDGTSVRDADLKHGAVLQVGATRLAFEVDDWSLPVAPVQQERYRGLVGASRAMKDLFAHLELVANTPLTVLLRGPTGCGKEVAARALHAASPRASAPFVVFDCGAVDRELIGATLFGHKEGAYTGATGARKGAFQTAHGGTLFLDEIGEMPLDLQPRLLRVLETREVQPLGADQPLRVDVRVVAATHRDLDVMVKAGTFREDLMYRLSGLVLLLPSLAERREDVAPLARHLLAQARPDAELAPEALARLEAHDWPGNVRELRNVVERAAALTRSTTIGAEDIRLGAVRVGAAPTSPPAAAPTGAPVTLQEAEAAAVRSALKASGGNKTQAAKLLGIARKTLREKMERFGIESDED
jgi:DNA-binding NtrC family response regulator